jgi:hypothetical protein
MRKRKVIAIEWDQNLDRPQHALIDLMIAGSIQQISTKGKQLEDKNPSVSIPLHNRQWLKGLRARATPKMAPVTQQTKINRFNQQSRIDVCFRVSGFR